MQSTGQRIEEKQELLKALDPGKEARLDEMFVHYVSSVYREPDTPWQQRRAWVAQAERVYEQALDGAIRDES